MITLTDAEKWELKAMDAEVRSAEYAAAMARVAKDQAISRILTAHGLPLATRCSIDLTTGLVVLQETAS